MLHEYITKKINNIYWTTIYFEIYCRRNTTR